MTPPPTMNLREYVLLVVDKVDEASASGNRDEAIRLLRVLRDAVDESVAKLQRETARKTTREED